MFSGGEKGFFWFDYRLVLLRVFGVILCGFVVFVGLVVGWFVLLLYVCLLLCSSFLG